MEVRVDGSRSSSENWLRASTASVEELPELSSAEESVARKLGISVESYARSQYAVALSAGELKQRAERLGAYVKGWLAEQNLAGTVESVWLMTLKGKYRIKIALEDRSCVILADEDLVDEVFESGSSRVERDLRHVFELNVLPEQAARLKSDWQTSVLNFY